MTIKKTLTQQPAGPADEPPPYSDHHIQSPPDHIALTAASSSSSVTPPRDAQKAQSPLKITQSHQPITGSFLITEIASDKPPPDVFLKTSHSKISTSIWFEPALKRPYIIEVATTHSPIEISLHVVSPGQAIDLTARSSHSKISVALTSDFHGILTCLTTHGKYLLSPELQARSVRVSLDYPPHESAVSYQIGGPGGESKAVLETSHSNINVGLVGDKLGDA